MPEHPCQPPLQPPPSCRSAVEGDPFQAAPNPPTVTRRETGPEIAHDDAVVFTHQRDHSVTERGDEPRERQRCPPCGGGLECRDSVEEVPDKRRLLSRG